MKKLLTIIAFIMCFSHITYTMEEPAPSYFAQLRDKLVKTFDPEKYVGDANNAELYNTISSVTRQCDLSELEKQLIKNSRGQYNGYRYALDTRCVERFYKAIPLIVKLSLEQNPGHKQPKPLYDLLKINNPIVGNLFIQLALKALREQVPTNSDDISLMQLRDLLNTIPDTGRLSVDALFFTLGMMSDTEQNIFHQQYQVLKKAKSTDPTQQCKTIECLINQLSPDKQLSFLLEMTQKKAEWRAQFASQLDEKNKRLLVEELFKTMPTETLLPFLLQHTAQLVKSGHQKPKSPREFVASLDPEQYEILIQTLMPQADSTHSSEENHGSSPSLYPHIMHTKQRFQEPQSEILTAHEQQQLESEDVH